MVLFVIYEEQNIWCDLRTFVLHYFVFFKSTINFVTVSNFALFKVQFWIKLNFEYRSSTCSFNLFIRFRFKVEQKIVSLLKSL